MKVVEQKVQILKFPITSDSSQIPTPLINFQTFHNSHNDIFHLAHSSLNEPTLRLPSKRAPLLLPISTNTPKSFSNSHTHILSMLQQKYMDNSKIYINIYIASFLIGCREVYRYFETKIYIKYLNNSAVYIHTSKHLHASPQPTRNVPQNCPARRGKTRSAERRQKWKTRKMLTMPVARGCNNRVATKRRGSVQDGPLLVHVAAGGRNINRKRCPPRDRYAGSRRRSL